MLRIVDQGTLSHTSGRGAYMPWITPLADGSWIATQHVGAELGSDDNHIVLLRSADGRDFSQLGRVGPTDDGFAYRVPQISIVDGNRFVLACTRFETETGALFDPESEALQRPELCLFWSDDGGTTWTDEPQIVELTAAIAWENWRARFNHALGIEAHGFTEGAFCPIPEPR